jgi:hypothetical protein
MRAGETGWQAGWKRLSFFTCNYIGDLHRPRQLQSKNKSSQINLIKSNSQRACPLLISFNEPFHYDAPQEVFTLLICERIRETGPVK